MRAKFYIFLCLMLSFSLAFGGSKGGSAPVAVRGYIKSNGTYVAPHYRSAPDGNVYNNWSTVGNVNPYTGEEGKKNPLPGTGLAAESETNVKRPEAATLASPQWQPNVAAESPNSLSNQLYTRSPSSTVAGKSPVAPKSLDLRALSSVERQSIDLACISAKGDGPAAMNRCMAIQLAAFERGPRAPDLRALSSAERQSIDLACISAKGDGPASMNRCLASQLAAFERGPRAPDLRALSSVERQSIDLACISAKGDGPAAMNRCLATQLATFERGPLSPNLSALSSVERQSIDLACISAKGDGPATMNKCLTTHLAAFERGPRSPDLSALSYAERQSIDLACISAKGDGPAAMNKCLHRQLQAMSAYDAHR